MENTENLILAIYAKEVTDHKTGKKFIAYETYDGDKNRISVSFTQNGKQAPKLTECPCNISIVDGVDAWRDNRKRFPIIRVDNYEYLGKLEKTRGSVFGKKPDGNE